MPYETTIVIEHLRAELANAIPSDHHYWKDEPLVYPVAGIADVQATNAALGFELPELLQRIFTEIGNGGYRLGPGIVGLPGGYDCREELDIVTDYNENATYFKWWQQFVVITDWGCAMRSYIDCSIPDGSVYRYDGNGFDSDEHLELLLPSADFWALEAPTLSDWFMNPPRG